MARSNAMLRGEGGERMMRVGDDDDRKKKLANILKAQKFCGDCFPA